METYLRPCCLFAVLLQIACASQTALQAAVPMVMHEDARLNDVFAVDERLIWAVGDRGTIWHSADGGSNWRLQDSTVDCALQAVYFLDGKNGWAVGGSVQPYTLTSSGVVLRTHDGGQHWQSEPRLLLPSLHYVRLVNATHGWAIGQRSALFSSSIFTTEDG